MHHALIKNLLHYDTKKLRCEGGNDNLYFHRNQAIHMKSRLEYKKLYQNKCFIYVCFYVDMKERCQKSNFYREPLWYSNGKFIVFPFVCFHAVDIKTILATKHGLARYVCTTNLTNNPKNVTTYEVLIYPKCFLF